MSKYLSHNYCDLENPQFHRYPFLRKYSFRVLNLTHIGKNIASQFLTNITETALRCCFNAFRKNVKPRTWGFSRSQYAIYSFIFLLFISFLSGCSFSQPDDTSGAGIIEDEALPETLDLIYNVNQDGELLDDVVDWYTMDTGNSAAIARINDLDPNSFLRRGQMVRIPKYMLKRTEPYVHRNYSIL